MRNWFSCKLRNLNRFPIVFPEVDLEFLGFDVCDIHITKSQIARLTSLGVNCRELGIQALRSQGIQGIECQESGSQQAHVRESKSQGVKS